MLDSIYRCQTSICDFIDAEDKFRTGEYVQTLMNEVKSDACRQHMEPMEEMAAIVFRSLE